MNVLPRSIDHGTGRPPHDIDASTDEAVDLERLVAVIRRQMVVIATGCAIGLALGLIYLLTAVPLFTAQTSLLIDPVANEERAQYTGVGENSLDTSAVDSQVEVLRSERIALAVASRLDLANNAEFFTDTSSIINRAYRTVRAVIDVRNWFSRPEPDAAEAAFQRQRAVVNTLNANTKFFRVDRTYVLAIQYTSPNPFLSAQIANAYADAYLTDILNAKYEATRRAGEWLQERIQELKQQALNADLAVQKFRADNNLVSAGGTLISERQLAELNSQLILARAERAQAEARWQRIQTVLQDRQMDAAVTESLQSPVINDLRARYLEASKREAEISQKLGEDHLQAVRLRSELKQYERLLFEELGRIAQSYESEVNVARSREESVQQDLSKLEQNSVSVNETQVTLRQLERESETFRTMYENFLTRYQQTVQNQSFPITEARVITQATKPQAPSHPRKSLILALTLVLGGAGGVAVGAVRELRERSFRISTQIRSELDLDCIGMLPRIAPDNADGRGTARRSGGGRTIKADPVMRHVLDHPLSIFSETLRVTKVSADLMLGERRPKVIGVISVLPDEGKTTVAKNFATLISHLGAKTLLVDGDLRNPGLTRALGVKQRSGFAEVLKDEAQIGSLLYSEPESGLDFLPANSRKISQTGMLLSSKSLGGFLEKAGSGYDYVIIDLPPLGPVVDARSVAQCIDTFVMVVEWGRTPRKLVRTILQSNPEVYEKISGVILNKVQTSRLKLYDDYGSVEYYGQHYGEYLKN